MKYLNNSFNSNLINKETFDEYSKSKHFSEASKILLNPSFTDILNLYKAQKGMSDKLNQKSNYLLLKFIIDLSNGDIYFWNSLFSDERHAYVDIFEEEPEIKDGIIISQLIISGTAFLNIDQNKLRGDDIINSDKFRSRVKNLSNEELEEFMYNFPVFIDYFDNVTNIVNGIVEDLIFKKKFDKYIEEKYNAHILKDFLSTYAKEAYIKLAYLF